MIVQLGNGKHREERKEMEGNARKKKQKEDKQGKDNLF
jgi:hypothetical protein